MAYRHVFLFVATALVAVGCGAGQTRSAADGPDTNETPPRDPNGPPSSADDSAPRSDDAPPRNEEAPPSSSDAPGGGGSLGPLCQQLCARIEAEQCGQGMSIFDMSDACSSGCEVPPGIVPCEPQLAGLFGCLLNLGSLCEGDQTQAEGEACRAAVEDFGDCAEAFEPPDTTEPNPNNPDPPNQGDACTTARGCDCPDDCSSCFCEAESQADLEACTTECM
jgi:hypothetical protein